MRKSILAQDRFENGQKNAVPMQGSASPVLLDKLCQQLHSSPKGLTTEEARKRLRKSGPNEPTAARRGATLRQLLVFLANPLVIILLLASIISAILGEVLNASIIITMVFLSVALNFFQTFRSQRAVERLRAGVALTAKVLRDGKWGEQLRSTLVPGDVIYLSAGDLVPADAQLIETNALHVQQAALTGESMPVEKRALSSAPMPSNAADAENQVFLGTSVVSGTATALITVTGRATAFGDIAARLATRPPETEFEHGIRRFGLFIMRTVFFLVLFVFVVSLPFHRQSPLESLLFAISLAVGLTPEFLPMITTVTLAQGASHMAKQKVIVKNLAAIQNFGSMDILCSDKTGTLTSGNTVLHDYLDPLGHTSERVLLSAYINSSCETGIKSPLDAAILQHTQLDVQVYHKLCEIPFDFERRRLSVVVENENVPILISKGAPESVVDICTAYEVDGQSKPWDADARTGCANTYQRLCAQGFRVLAVAYRRMTQQASYTVEDEQGMTLLGFLTFFDPPLEDVGEVLQALHRDGVEVKILTGDNELVARHVCEQVGLDGGRIVLGEELDHMSDTALQHIAEQTSVFARVSPAQKNRILLALKHRGHVVGFMGDGINDAPSLHAADVGISVSTAVDVAKDAADIILLEQGLRVVHSGIIEGRKGFGNVMKYLLMGTSSNFGNMFSMAGASIFLPFLPMLPTQILLNNFLYDLSQVTIPTDHVDASYIIKPRRWDIKLIRDFMLYIGPVSSIFDFLTFFIMLQVFHATAPLFHTGWFVESLATQTLVLFIIRTTGNPLRSRPSLPLTITVLLIVAFGMLLPFTPLAGPLGFTPLPAQYFLFLAGMIVTYLLLVEVVKRWLMRRLVK
ncbi:MAG TPA: magnesium-translocating P-type ATPase [Ktedonobacteraceae bacterium]